uniref:Uncharacterized protein n=1 Tax=Mucochytrium quahogii TaxID=96639 RepID=A0A7S2S1X2_9STRA|mmetsp:Transcript_1073/g.1736  ORF Transcript_1073/g.1736 Transcript_1073/m.1736 type:complete len:394 (+) Transcript_1073:2150-3331(+)|eukprot:CAMPEP_0203746188 /NCGR_PEP_ID=MMETSP0098-20131031/1702_1 /ASSEMBLY_ACC=CAM_ASM_000208 /TAXON_ID=96639 /ORGANISM=" , Strain NY0313808BC1" /LENGTH=393 /DNA_ID=CAMNT_0050634187 /DNA_START=1790 /DNA_END=2971 /DNA_ORIENTATION=-
MAGYGCKVGSGKYFDDGEVDRDFVAFGEMGMFPPRGLGLEHLCLSVGELDDMKEKCIELGCVGFSSKTGRFFKALVSTDRWVKSSCREDQVFVLDSTPPWHHLDMYCTLPEHALEDDFESASIEVEFYNDIPRTTNLYLCFFGGTMNNGSFYSGLQTNVGCPGHAHGGPRVFTADKAMGEWAQRDAQIEKEQDFGAIFSRWGPASIADAAVPCDPHSFAEADGYEGTFCSVRRHVEWGKGKYTLSLTLVSREENGSWVRYDITPEHGTMETIGWLLFRGTKPLRFKDRTIYNFVETYGGSVDTFCVNEYPPFKMQVDSLKFNGTLCEPPTKIEYFKQVPLFAYSFIPKDVPWKVTTVFGETCFGTRPDQTDTFPSYGTYELGTCQPNETTTPS